MVSLFEFEDGDDPAAFDKMDELTKQRILAPFGVPEMLIGTAMKEIVVLRDPVTGDEQRVNAGLENIIKIFKSVGYQVVGVGYEEVK